VSKHSTENGKPAKRLQERIESYENSVSGRSFINSYPQSSSIKNTLTKPGSNKK
jgi:hypothetical protein